MTLFEFVSCTVFPAAELAVKGTPLSGGNPLRFAALACLILPSMVAGTAALAYVSYPVKARRPARGCASDPRSRACIAADPAADERPASR